MIISIVLWVVAASSIALWLARTVSTGALAARGRGVVLRSGVDTVVMLALVRALAPPPGEWSWLWLVATAAVGLGLAAAVRRWPDLPWRAARAQSGSTPGSPPGSTAGSTPDSDRGSDRGVLVGSLGYAAVGAALVAVLA